MKIAISGTHSTGKTTFLARLQASLGRSIPTVAGLPREAANLGFPILKEHNFQSTLWLMAAGMQRELEAGLRSPLVLVDRPVMEPAAYLLAALKFRGEMLPAAEQSCLREIARSYMFTYDLVLKTVVDPALPISNNKKRDHDAPFRALVDEEIDAFYAGLGLSVRSMRVGDEQVFSEVLGMTREAFN